MLSQAWEKKHKTKIKNLFSLLFLNYYYYTVIIIIKK